MKRTIDDTLKDLVGAMQRRGYGANKQEILRRVGHRRPRRRSSVWWAASAAVFLAAVVVVSVTMHHNPKTQTAKQPAVLLNTRYGYATAIPKGWKVTTFDGKSPSESKDVLLLPGKGPSGQDGPDIEIRVCNSNSPCMGDGTSKILSATKRSATLAGVQGIEFQYKMTTVAGTRNWLEDHQVVRHDGFTYDVIQSIETMQPVKSPASIMAPSAAYKFVQQHWAWKGPQGVVPGGPPITNLHMVDPHHGWAMQNGGLLYTADGGAAWSAATPPHFGRGATAAYGGPQAAWFAWPAPDGTARIYVAHTTDKGRHWSESELARFPWKIPLYTQSVCFTDKMNGWLLAEPQHGMNSSPGVLFATKDGGKTWRQVAQTGIQGNLPLGGSVVFRTAHVGYLSGSPVSTGPARIYRTADGGVSWQEIKLPLPHGDEQISAGLPFVSPSGSLLVDAYLEGAGSGVTGDALYASKDGGVHWKLEHITKVLPLQWLDSQYGWAAPSGKFTRTMDGGKTWAAVSGPVLAKVLQNHRIVQVQFLSPQEGWLVAQNQQGSVVLRTTDGGGSWKLLDK